jgi:hypothetical protein
MFGYTIIERWARFLGVSSVLPVLFAFVVPTDVGADPVGGGNADVAAEDVDLLKHLKPRMPRGWRLTHFDRGTGSPAGWRPGAGTFLTIENDGDADAPAVRIAIMDPSYAEHSPEDAAEDAAIPLPRWRKRPVFVRGGEPNWIGVKSDVLIAGKVANESRYPGFLATPPPDLSTDRIEEADIDAFLQNLSRTVITDRQSFLDLMEEGKRVFRKGRPVSKDQYRRLVQICSGQIGEYETFCIHIGRLYPRSVPRRGYDIHLEVSSDRRIVDFYWQYPIELDAPSVPLEQLSFFHRHLESQEYIRAIQKGHQIFTKGRKLPEEFPVLFKQYHRGPSKDGDRYVFLKGSSAWAWMSIDPDTRMVKHFTAAFH